MKEINEKLDQIYKARMNLRNQVKKKEETLKEYERMIRESKNAYKNLVDNSNKMIEILQQETLEIQKTIRNN